MGKSGTGGIERLEQQFFALLRSGLWNKAIDVTLFEGEVAWRNLLEMGQKQTVLGVLADGIEKLPVAYRPPLSEIRWLQMQVVAMKRHYVLLNHTLKEISKDLRTAGIHAVLLKGQGVAQYYRYPEQRQCGDIDLYVSSEEYVQACNVVRNYGIATGEESENRAHCHFSRNQVTVEVHRLVTYSDDPFMDCKLQGIVNRYFQNTSSYKVLAETDIWLPPINFNAFYLFFHLVKHFIMEGVGLRQICDWTLFLHVHQREIDKEQLLDDVRSVGMLKLWKIFGCIAVNYIGLPMEEFPGFQPVAEKRVQRVINLIFYVGNFGHYTPQNGTRPANYYKGKLYSFHKRYWWKRQIMPLCPMLIGRWTFFSLFHSIKVVLLHR